MTETTGSTATPESGNPEGADGAAETTPADGEKKSGKREKKSGKRAKKGLFARIGLFYRQIIAELRKVVWPTRSELTNYTAVVVTFVVVMMAIVAGLDYGFSKLSLWIFG
ncbi:preprotein translocase subunit SecE [Streptomyces sp. 1114.5]|uniref:preprotein translocase subunit SecE n=1 Tax=unclassified Streptomyces TaxID=2593676 RepID=UPI000BD5FF26|nr:MULTISPECIES: preprotein translocase subunit SecE [unclassified Streptomyces]RKT17348.1 preprotein translocase subunit SecE [Streptomyces sp. 1114.5]SOB83557.1 preprotein translocase subunit SecE [Streptomyces sp. 1331.2]